MKLVGQELNLFVRACADPHNVPAQQVLNLFGAATAGEALVQLQLAPLGIFVDVITHIRLAVLHEASRQDPRWGDMLERILS